MQDFYFITCSSKVTIFLRGAVGGVLHDMSSFPGKMSHISNDDPNKQNESMFDKLKETAVCISSVCVSKLSLKDKKKIDQHTVNNCQVELSPSKVPILKKEF